jgi:hypothetical protein
MEAGAIAVEGGPNGTVAARAWATTPRPTWSTASAPFIEALQANDPLTVRQPLRCRAARLGRCIDVHRNPRLG